MTVIIWFKIDTLLQKYTLTDVIQNIIQNNNYLHISWGNAFICIYISQTYDKPYFQFK